MALTLANFGAPSWVFLLLFAWMLTVGLPTSLAIVVTVSSWSGGSPESFIATVAIAALTVQLVALRLVGKRFRRRAR